MSNSTAEAGAAPLDIIGFKVSSLDFAGNIDLIGQAALSGQGLWVFTLNLEMAARAATDPSYRALVQDIDLTVADGMPIVLLSRLGLTPHRLPGRTCGVDMVQHFLTHFSGRMGILGGVDPRAALRKLGGDPARVVYIYDGKVDPDNLDEIVQGLRSTGCQLLFVALGVPKQDKVCRALRKHCPSIVSMGIGGSFEILGGLQPRAPKLLRAAGFEWLFRLLREPRRLAYRYLVLYPQVLPSVIAWIRTVRAARSA